MNIRFTYVELVYTCLFSILLVGQFIASTGLPLVVATAIRLLLLGLLLLAYCQLFRTNQLKLPGGFMKYFIIAFFIYSFIIIFRGEWSLSLKGILSNLVDTEGCLIFFLPLIIIPLPNSKHIKQILRVAFYFSLLVVPLWILNSNHLYMAGQSNSFISEGVGMWMPYISAFLLPLRGVLSKRERIVNFCIYFIYFFLMLLNARRNVCLSFFIFTLISFFVTARLFISKNILSRGTIIFASVICSLLLLMSFKPLLNGPFSFLKERGLENTRYGVEAFFVADMMTSPVSDWIFGRGMDGAYEQFFADDETGDYDDSRQIIETGYLNNMLKGGLLYNLFILIFITAGIKRYFSSSLASSKYFAAILITYILDLYTSNPVCIFSPRSILFWLLVSL